MSARDLACRDERRRNLVRARSRNGVDFVDVKGVRLCVHFLTGVPVEFLPAREHGTLTPADKALALAHIVIRGGRRIVGLRAIDFDPHAPASRYDESCLEIELDGEGDWSTYTIGFVATVDGRPTDAPLPSLDPRYAQADFTFKIDCPAEIDCVSSDTCVADERPAPAISYLAKDYATFRQLILDRLALTMPDWRERHVPDLGITLVELLAYVGDHLSYYQDAVATEQYLDTARQRISVRRHARLVDYAMHEGCNARTFVELQVSRDESELDPHDLYFVTPVSGAVALREEALEGPARWITFEPLTSRRTLNLRTAHNAIRIYTWGDAECCLAAGATRATLLDELSEHDEPAAEVGDQEQKGAADRRPPARHGCDDETPGPPAPGVLDLAPGDYLLFEELACAGTIAGSPQGGILEPQPDADRTHRHVVRLTRATRGYDALRGNRVLEVEWSRDDALPFALCLSAIGSAPCCALQRDLSVARGNVLLVDHGKTVRDEPLPPVETLETVETCLAAGTPADVARVAARFRPTLEQVPLTFAQPLDPGASAAAALIQDARAALPSVVLAAIPPAFDGEGPLFTTADLAGVPGLAAALLAPADDRLRGLRRRLRAEVRQMLEHGSVTPELVDALRANLRALTEPWTASPDLLDSDRDDASFVAEIDDDGKAHLRFGDGDCGRACDPGMAFLATYRVGNGRAGLVGAESIAHVVYRSGWSDLITRVRNPLPAVGAIDPEPIAEVKMFAPGAFRGVLERAVTADDYAALATFLRYPARDPHVQSAAAALHWNGSWYEADVAIDPMGTSDPDAALQASIRSRLARARRLGHDLRVGPATIVALRLELDLCVKPGYLRAHVLAAIRDALGSRILPGGRRGFFHPDNLTFGGGVYVSRIVAAVMAVDGVAEVHVVRLERLAHDRSRNPDFAQGYLALAANEIARLDNDPAAPENGILSFRHVRGGR